MKRMICERAKECTADIHCGDKVEHEFDEYCDKFCEGLISGSFKGARCVEVPNKSEVK